MGKTLQQSESWKGTAQPGQLDGQICKACLADRRGGRGRSVLQPAHGLLALVEIEFAHLRQHQRIKHAVGEGAQRAVGHQGDLADLVVHGIDELQVCKQGADALPTGVMPMRARSRSQTHSLAAAYSSLSKWRSSPGENTLNSLMAFSSHLMSLTIAMRAQWPIRPRPRRKSCHTAPASMPFHSPSMQQRKSSLRCLASLSLTSGMSCLS